MHACDVIGYVDTENGGPIVCPGCATDAERDERTGWAPIFGDAETDTPNHCERCEDLIPETWTEHGWRSVVATLVDALQGTAGRLCILRQWYDYADAWSLAQTYADMHGAPQLPPTWKAPHLSGPERDRARTRRNALVHAFRHVAEHRLTPIFDAAPFHDEHSPARARA